MPRLAFPAAPQAQAAPQVQTNNKFNNVDIEAYLMGDTGIRADVTSMAGVVGLNDPRAGDLINRINYYFPSTMSNDPLAINLFNNVATGGARAGDVTGDGNFTLIDVLSVLFGRLPDGASPQQQNQFYTQYIQAAMQTQSQVAVQTAVLTAQQQAFQQYQYAANMQATFNQGFQLGASNPELAVAMRVDGRLPANEAETISYNGTTAGILYALQQREAIYRQNPGLRLRQAVMRQQAMQEQGILTTPNFRNIYGQLVNIWGTPMEDSLASRTTPFTIFTGGINN